jgi:CheY-like chemotaxis protein
VSPRLKKLLHVEDSLLPRRILAEQLAAVPDYRFAITCVATEDEAVRAFSQGGVDGVILDYHLAEGDGLSCLRRLRQLDPIVPIIAASGEATAEIAAELLRVGADDYISKSDLLSGAITRSLCAALARADALRPYHAAGSPHPAGQTGALFQEVCQLFASAAGPQFLDRLERCEAAARQERVTPRQLEHWFEVACEELAAGQPSAARLAQRLLRPVLLEMLMRLSSDEQQTEAEAKSGSVHG